MVEGENIATGNAGGTGGQGAGTGASAGNAGSTGGQGGSAGANGGDQGAPQGGGEKSWRDSLPEQLRGESGLAAFKSVEDLAKSYVHSQALIGRDKVVIPGEKASQEDWDNFYAKAGRPESPDKYGVKVAELGEEGSKELAATAYKLGLSPKQLQGLVEWSDQSNKKQMETFQAQQKLQQTEARNEYIKQLGGEDKFKVAFEKAGQALEYTADPEFREYLLKSGLGADPKMIKFFAGLADRMKEDGIKGHGGAQFGSKVSELQEKVAGIENQPGYFDGHHSSHKALVEQAHELRMMIASLQQK